MAKKKPISDELCDFDTAGTSEVTTAFWQGIQRRLYSVSNPYVGNKRGIILDIAHALENNGVQYDSVLDLFGGSGVVSLFMKLIGKKVFYNDLLTSSYYNGLSFVENTNITLTEDDLKFLGSGAFPAINSFVRDTYAERFTADESLYLDKYRTAIPNLLIKRFDKPMVEAHRKDDKEKSSALDRQAQIMRGLCYVTIEHYIMENCFLGGRLNKGQVLANLDHRLEHQRNNGSTMKFALTPPQLFPEGQGNCTAFNLDADALLDKAPLPKIDLLYLDPPYGSSQSDYAQMFRFCEEYIYGATLEELPHLKEASKKFVQSKGYEGHFRDLLAKCDRFPTWAISYSEASFGTIDDITKILHDFRKNVTVVNIDHEYRYRKERGSVTEYLIICRG